MASEENYHVFIRPDIGTEVLEFFSTFASRVRLKDGRYLHYLRCSKIDAGHPIYLEATVYRKDSDVGILFQVPHYMVLTISGPTDQPTPIGFTHNDT